MRRLDPSASRVLFIGAARTAIASLGPRLESRDVRVEGGPAEPSEWLGGPGERALVVSAGDDKATMIVTRARLRVPGARIVALLDGFSIPGLVSALSMGATSVADARAEPPTVAAQIELGLHGWVALPTELLPKIRDFNDTIVDTALSDDQLRLLAALADEISMHAVAERMAMSRRTLYRRVAALYSALGVDSRLSAVALGTRLGLLEQPR